MNSTLPTLDSVTIIAKRWFQKSCGNTYHSCVVKVNGQTLPKVAFAYGYGEHYLQTAISILQENGYWPLTDERLPSGIDKNTNDFYIWKMENRDKFTVICEDVTRKRDL